MARLANFTGRHEAASDVAARAWGVKLVLGAPQMARLSTTACLTSAAGSAAAVSGQQDGTREETRPG